MLISQKINSTRKSIPAQLFCCSRSVSSIARQNSAGYSWVTSATLLFSCTCVCVHGRNTCSRQRGQPASSSEAEFLFELAPSLIAIFFRRFTKSSEGLPASRVTPAKFRSDRASQHVIVLECKRILKFPDGTCPNNAASLIKVFFLRASAVGPDLKPFVQVRTELHHPRKQRATDGELLVDPGLVNSNQLLHALDGSLRHTVGLRVSNGRSLQHRSPSALSCAISLSTSTMAGSWSLFKTTSPCIPKRR